MGHRLLGNPGEAGPLSRQPSRRRRERYRSDSPCSTTAHRTCPVRPTGAANLRVEHVEVALNATHRACRTSRSCSRRPAALSACSPEYTRRRCELFGLDVHVGTPVPRAADTWMRSDNIRSMPRLPRVTADRVVRALRRAGWRLHRHTGGHAHFAHPAHPGRVVTVPMHAGKIIPLGTLRAILHSAGLDGDELR